MCPDADRSVGQRREPALKAHLRQEIETGLSLARDPKNAGLPALALRTTTMYSPWYTRTCPTCRHRFREGDQVRQCPECGQAYHDDDQYGLLCWQTHFAGGQVCRAAKFDPFLETATPGCAYRWSGELPTTTPASGQKQGRRVITVERQFLRGLEREWSPFGNEQVIFVPAGDPIIGHNCPWCRFQVRAGDRVVKCPCGKCDTYFHDDIFRHLTCWNEWNGSTGHDYCPTTGARIIKPGAALEPADES